MNVPEIKRKLKKLSSKKRTPKQSKIDVIQSLVNSYCDENNMTIQKTGASLFYGDDSVYDRMYTYFTSFGFDLLSTTTTDDYEEFYRSMRVKQIIRDFYEPMNDKLSFPRTCKFFIFCVLDENEEMKALLVRENSYQIIEL